MKHIFVSHVCS